MHLLPGRRSQWEAASPVSFRHCERQWPLVAVPSGHAPAILQRWTRSVDSLHCTRLPLALGVSGIRTKVLISYLYFMAKKKKKKKEREKRQEKCLMFSCCHKSTKGRNAFINWQLDRICKMRVGLCFFLFTYITYALIFFFMVPKMKENFDIWDARKLRSYFCWLELSWCLGIWKKK